MLKSYLIPVMVAALAQLLHCVVESVACPMGLRANADSPEEAAVAGGEHLHRMPTPVANG
jgi:hypothetical protein